jgi:L-ascorbate metabolism protein UlaG (beta-lactamase superfamily)
MNIFQKTMMTISILIIALLFFSIFWFMKQPSFGKIPSGERLTRIQQSPNYKEGKFRNIHPTPNLVEGVSYYKVMKEFFFGKSKRSRPPAKLPSEKTDLLHLDPNSNCLVWFGHSSYFIQIDGKKILVDPVFSGHASPVKFTTKSFDGSDVYSTADIPEIDYLFISHDHWDHLDYETILNLKPKIKKIITSLGVGAHLEYWGYNTKDIIEEDWNVEINLGNGFKVHTTPARHFAGRGFKRDLSLWSSFVLETPTMRLFLGGDSGYDTHFAEIGNSYGPFDLAILECGQYNPYWKYIHMMPEEVVQAGIDLKAKRILPVHWSKFSLSLHAWDDPILRITKEATIKNMPLLHPLIGQEVNLNSSNPLTDWWDKLKG